MVNIKDFKQNKTAFILILKEDNVERRMHSNYMLIMTISI